MSECLSDELLILIVDGEASAELRGAALDHADACGSCRALLAAAGGLALREAPAGATEAAPVARGMTVGRYLVLDLLGAGAMGDVHACYDPELDRRVALKVLRGVASKELDARLAREAQAMANLSHPNVIPVFDVGRHDGRLFVAMEHVSGRTLRAWLAEEERPWREIVRVFIDAGRGLAAAHAIGIVHRDFKPDNVLIGTDGRVRVADFGLAQTRARPDERGSGRAGEGPPLLLTAAGEVLGTPAYMAPEQMRGDGVSAAADQFSFAIALYEALCRRRPFTGDTPGELLAAMLDEQIVPPETRLPRRLRRALGRALRARPEERFASMGELLSELERVERASSTRAAVVVIAVGAVAAALLYARSASSVSCAGGDAEMATIWNGARKEAIRRAIAAGRAPYAAAAASGFEAAVDDYTVRWVSAQREACLATRQRGTQSEQLLDLRVACLRARRRDLAALLDVLSMPAPSLADRAVSAAQGLTPLTSCDAAPVLAARVAAPSDPATRAGVEELRASLAVAGALDGAGQYAPAEAAARQLVVRARALGHAPVEGEAFHLLASILYDRGQYDAARAAFGEAFQAAAAGGDERTEAAALLGVLDAAGAQQGRWPELGDTIRRARVIAARVGDEALSDAIAMDEGISWFNAGDAEAAHRRFLEVLGVRQRLFGSESFKVAAIFTWLGRSSSALGRLDDSRAQRTRSLALFERLYHGDHPAFLAAVNNLGITLRDDSADLEAALPLFERAVKLARMRSAENPHLANALANLALTRGLLGEYDAAIDLARQAHAMALATSGGAVQEKTAWATYVLGTLLLDTGRFEESVALHRQLVAAWEKLRGVDDVQVAGARLELARAESASGPSPEAVAEAERGLDIGRRRLAPSHPERAQLEVAYCTVLVEQGEAARALPVCLHGAEATAARFGPDHVHTAFAATALGNAYLATGRPELALPLLERAVATLEARRGFGVARARARALLERARAAGRDQRRSE